MRRCRKVELRHKVELAGESLREIGVLLLVFVPLDATFYQGEVKPLAIIGLVILAFVGLALILAGIWLEGRN